MYDYFDNCCGDMGFLSYGTDGEVRANLTKDVERENNGTDTENNMGAEGKMGT